VSSNPTVEVWGRKLVTNATPAAGQIPIGNGQNFSLSTLTAGANVTIDGTTTPGQITISASGGPVVAGSTGYVQYNNAGSLGASANLFWDIANSRLGVGTSAPASKLSVSSASFVQVQATTGIVDFRIQSIDAFSAAGSGTVSNHAYAFTTNNLERMRIDTSGNVGIGTSSPSYQLTIQGTGQETANLTDAGNKGGSLFLRATAVGSGSGGAVLFGTTFGNLTPFAAIKGLISDGTTNTIGDLAFSTRNAIAATSLTERMRLTYDGNVGIGTSSPAYKLDVTGQGRATTGFAVSIDGSTFTPSGLNAIPNYGMGYITSTSQTIISGFGGIPFYTNQAERMRIDGFGNVGIGTSSPVIYGLSVAKASGGAGLRVSSGANNSDFVMSGTDLYIANNVAGTIQFYINSAERVRIDSNGNVQINTTNAAATGATCRFTIQDGATYLPFGINNNAAGTGASNVALFARNGTGTGTISVTGTTTAYNTSSDYRLKHDVQPMLSGLSTIAALKPSTYKWNADNSPGEGFIAHELQAVIPQAVIGEKDAVNDDGSIKSQGVDYSKIVVHLVVAIQELSAKVAVLEGKQ